MMRLSISVWIAAALAVVGGVPPSFAQSSDSGPALGVARVSLINGQVTVKRGQDGDWVSAGVNTPLVEGDLVETGPGSRAEFQLDYSNLIRLDQSTRAEFTALGQRNFRVRLLEGRMTYSELKGGEADVDIETPFVAVRPRKNGRYEIEVGPVETVIQVRRGKAEIASADGLQELDRGRMMVVREGFDGGPPEFRFARAENRDDWDRWNESRDDRLARADSYRYVDRSIAGAHDLDYHGDWRYVSGYGNCWFPRVNYGWAPYRQGRWSWVDYYGWTWVGHEPWGWAPYHYGRWFYNAGFGWGWYPGPRSYRHYWRPALVSFFGWNSRSGFSLSVGLGFGRIGWVPLAPGERFYPWYGRGGGYWGGGRTKIKNSTIIVDNSVNIYNNYRNARAHNGVTVVDAQGFSQGRLNNAQTLRGAELQRASLVRGRIPVVPDRRAQGSIVRAGTSATARTANIRTFSRAGTQASPRVARTSFTQQQSTIAQSVRDFRTSRAGVTTGRTGSTGAINSGGVRAGSTARGGSAARPSNSVRGGVTPSTARSGSTGRTSVRSGSRTPDTTTRTTTPGVRSAAPSRAGDSQRWRSFGGDAGARSGPRSTVRTPSTSRTPSASRAPTTRRVPSVSRSGSSARTPSATRSPSRVGSQPRTTTRTPSASRSRVPSASRAPSSSRTPSVSRTPSRTRVPSASRAPSGSRVPSASRSRVPSASRSPSPSRSAPSVNRSRVPSASRAPSSSRSPSVSRSRAPSVSRRSAPSPSRSRAPQPSVRRSAPSPSRSAPTIRSSPSRSRGGGSFGGVSRSRSAPSRPSGGVSRGGGGSVRSAPSRSSGGTRSARRR